MEVNSTNSPLYLIKADIVESLEACTGDCPNTMIRHEEVFFPSHEDVLPLREVSEGEVGFPGQLPEGSPCRESRPVVHICFIGCAPRRVSGLERVLRTDYFSFEESRQCWMVFRKT